MKRNSSTVILFAASLMILGCSGYSVEPGKVTVETLPNGTPLLHGTYALRESREGSDQKTGGGCLVTQSAVAPQQCRKGACGVDDASRAAGMYGYCADDNTCWYRPGPPQKFCNIHKGAMLDVNQQYRAPETGGVNVSATEPSRWRVVTCQNIAPGKCAAPDAAEGVAKKTRFGPITDIPAK